MDTMYDYVSKNINEQQHLKWRLAVSKVYQYIGVAEHSNGSKQKFQVQEEKQIITKGKAIMRERYNLLVNLFYEKLIDTIPVHDGHSVNQSMKIS